MNLSLETQGVLILQEHLQHLWGFQLPDVYLSAFPPSLFTVQGVDKFLFGISRQGRFWAKNMKRLLPQERKDSSPSPESCPLQDWPGSRRKGAQMTCITLSSLH